MNSIIKPKGSYWSDLNKSQQVEILKQIPKLVSDPNYINYKYYYSLTFKHWIISNIMAVPMRSLNTLKVSNG